MEAARAAAKRGRRCRTGCLPRYGRERSTSDSGRFPEGARGDDRYQFILCRAFRPVASGAGSGSFSAASPAQTLSEVAAQTGLTRAGARDEFSKAVARSLFKLMAYKDEYEVARLHSDPEFLRSIQDRFEGDYRLNYHLAPPLLARRNERGELIKQRFGPWVLTGFKALSKLKFLRGSWFDPFGHTEERRTERALIARYREGVLSWLTRLNDDTLNAALAFARSPEDIKGYGHVKARHVQAVLKQWG